MDTSRVTRRRFVLAAALGLAGVGLTACGGTAATAGTSSTRATTIPAPSVAQSTKPVASSIASTTSTVAAASAAASATGRAEVWAPWGVGLVQQGYVASLQALNQQQPNVKAAYAVASPWPTKFVTAAAGGVPPDVIFCGLGQAMQVIAWAYKKLLAPLDTYITAGKVSEKDFYTPAWRENVYQGKNYALVVEVDPNFPLLYNKSLFSQVGLDPTKPPTTIAEFDAANQKLLAKDGDTITRMGSTPPWSVSSDANSLLTWFTAFGGGFIDAQSGKLNVTTPENTAALDWIATYARTYNFDAVTAFVKTFGKNGAVSALADGKIAMAPVVSTGYQQLADLTKTGATRIEDFAFGYLPTSTAEQANKGWLGGWAVAMPTGAPHPDNGWEIIRWLSATPQGTDAWASVNGFLPGYRPSPFLTRMANQPGFEWYLKVLQAAQTTPPNVAGWGDIPAEDFHQVLYDPVQGKTSAADALGTFQRVVSAFLSTYS